MPKPEIAIVGGTGQENLWNYSEQVINGTPYGLASPIFIGDMDGKTVAFMPRHGIHHNVPPHKVNYRANIYALHNIGVKRIVATNAVGAINPRLKPGNIVVPHDLVDFTKFRRSTYYDDDPVTHTDVSQPYCPEIRSTFFKAARKLRTEVVKQAVLVCTEGPRYETRAEILMFGKMGCDIVGMTGMPETVLARELEICYASACLVTNMAAGLQKKLSSDELVKVVTKETPVIQQLLRETIRHLPAKRQCSCAHALEQARFRG